MTTPKITEKTYNLILKSPQLTTTQAQKVRTYIQGDNNKEIREKRYREYLESVHWKDFSNRVLQLINHSCESCLSPSGIDIHHICYRRVGEERFTDVLGLCRECNNSMQSGLVSTSKTKDKAWKRRTELHQNWKSECKNEETGLLPDKVWSKTVQASKKERRDQSRRDRTTYVKATLKAGSRPKGTPRTLWKTETNEMKYRHKATTFPYDSIKRKEFFERNPHLNSPQI